MTLTLVLVSLANRANHETGECWPKIETIAHECSCSIRSVQRYVGFLEEKGLVKVEPRFIKGRQTSSLYWLQIPGAPFQGREERRGARPSPHGSPVLGKPQSFGTPRGATAVAPFNNQQNRHSPKPPTGLVVGNAEGLAQEEMRRSSSAAPPESQSAGVSRSIRFKDRGTYEAEIMKRLGTTGIEIMLSLPDSEVDELCWRQREGKLTAFDISNLQDRYRLKSMSVLAPPTPEGS